MKRRSTVIIVCASLLVIAIGYLCYMATPVDSQDQLAIRIAKNEVRKRGWTLFRVTSVENRAEQWLVTIERLPPTLGGHATVEITNGEVSNYYRGK